MTLKSKLLGRWDPRDYARHEGGKWVLDPEKFYPAMIKHIRESLEHEDLPAELVDRNPRPEIDPMMAARRYRNWAVRIPTQAWEDAECSFAEVVEHGDLVRVARRAEVLECARLWFTRALKNTAKDPIYIRILNDPRFRLGVGGEFRA